MIVCMEVPPVHPYWPGVGHMLSFEPIAMVGGCRTLIGQLGLPKPYRAGGCCYRNQVRFARCTASRNAERFAAKRGVIRKADMQADGRPNLKYSSLKPRGWSIYEVKNKEAGRSEARRVWGKGAVIVIPAQA